ncbi:hypothetical protein MN116_001631 [Schistosoma mekongi]|uniref:RRM domain-containing protein n=1 Tax=Schistosoma mekongi TaxID=38744 RepID=A0AAE1ZI74_SCHME|nr:hypothetical protein MN116_001631 [Schistosoma mekongi]
MKSPKVTATPDPKSKQLSNGKTTPVRPASKRPIPVGSDDSDAENESGVLCSKELKTSHKKMKLATAKEMEPKKTDLSSDDDEEEEDDGDSEENEDYDRDSEEDEDDDEDSEEDEDDSSEQEEGESDDESELSAQKSKATNSLLGSIVNQKTESLKGEKPAGDKTQSSAKQQVLPDKGVCRSESHSDAQSGSAAGNVLILHAPDNLSSLREFLSKISPVTSINKIEPSPIMATVSNIGVLRSRLKSGKLVFQGKELQVIPIDNLGGVEKPPTKALFVSGIPKSVTAEQFKNHLSNCQPVSFRLLDKHPKANSAIMSFPTIDIAKQARQVLSSLTLEGRTLRVQFTTEQDRTSPDNCAKIAVLNCPASPKQLRKIFPTCVDVFWIQKKRKAILKFPSLEARKDAVSKPKFFSGQKLKLALVGGPELKTAVVWGFPADAKKSDIKGLFNGVVSVSRENSNFGNKQPPMVVEFENAADCLNAITSNATLEGRRLSVFLKEVYLDDLSDQPKQTGQLVNKTKVAETSDSSKAKISKSEEVADSDDDSDEDDDDEDMDEEDDETGDDDESEDESEDGSEDAIMASSKADGKQSRNSQGQRSALPKSSQHPENQNNFKAQNKAGGGFKSNSFRGRGRGGQSPRGRGGQSSRGRSGDRGGWSKRGGHRNG